MWPGPEFNEDYYEPEPVKPMCSYDTERQSWHVTHQIHEVDYEVRKAVENAVFRYKGFGSRGLNLIESGWIITIKTSRYLGVQYLYLFDPVMCLIGRCRIPKEGMEPFNHVFDMEFLTQQKRFQYKPPKVIVEDILRDITPETLMQMATELMQAELKPVTDPQPETRKADVIQLKKAS